MRRRVSLLACCLLCAACGDDDDASDAATDAAAPDSGTPAGWPLSIGAADAVSLLADVAGVVAIAQDAGGLRISRFDAGGEPGWSHRIAGAAPPVGNFDGPAAAHSPAGTLYVAVASGLTQVGQRPLECPNNRPCDALVVVGAGGELEPPIPLPEGFRHGIASIDGGVVVASLGWPGEASWLAAVADSGESAWELELPPATEGMLLAGDGTKTF